LVVMPFVSGGGVKNKLLEAAAMGKAIVGTSRVTNGLRGQLPLATGDSPNAMAGEVVRLATDDRARRELGLAARDWVRTHQTWDASATVAIAGIRQAMREKAKS
jgi:glycosyltransferase involved in cell wall biosynthesis